MDASAAGYSVFILVWFCAWLGFGDSTWWLTILNREAPYLFLPAVVFLMYSIVLRKTGMILPFLIPAFAFLWIYYPYVIPGMITGADDPAAQLRILTYNVLYSNRNYDDVANAILSNQPDLVALQEVQPEMMSALEMRLGDEYPYSKMGDQNDFGTTAVFSRYPFKESYVLDLKMDRPAVFVTTEIKGRRLMFASAHLLAYGLIWVKPPDIPRVITERTEMQNQQAEILLGNLADQSGLAILACDCNSQETASSHRILDGSMTNSARETGWQPFRAAPVGLHSDIRLQHIDYVWYKGALSPDVVYFVDDSGGSDHHPVLAIFKLE